MIRLATIRAVGGVSTVFLASLLRTESAAAQHSPFARLTLTADRSSQRCVTDASLREAASNALGYDPFLPLQASAPARVTIVVRASSSAGRLRLDASVQRPHDPAPLSLPSLRDRQCDGLLAALGGQIREELSEPLSREEPAPQSPAPPIPPTQTAIVQSSTETHHLQPAQTTLVVSLGPASTAARAERPAKPEVVLWAGAIGLLNATPSAGVGVVAGVGLMGRRWSVALEGRLDLPTATGESAQDVEVALRMGALSGCGRLTPRLSLCGVGYVGQIISHAVSSPANATEHYWTFVTAARGVYTLPLVEPLGIRFFAELGAPWIITHVAIARAEQVRWSTPSVCAAAGIAATLTF